MSGKRIAAVTYLDTIQSHPSLEHNQKVWLTNQPPFLNIVSKADQQILVSIPWNNISEIVIDRARKTGMASFVTTLANVFGFGTGTEWGSPFHVGLFVVYRDEAVQRDRNMFFNTGGERRAENIGRELGRLLDESTSILGQAGSPQTKR